MFDLVGLLLLSGATMSCLVLVMGFGVVSEGDGMRGRARKGGGKRAG